MKKKVKIIGYILVIVLLFFGGIIAAQYFNMKLGLIFMMNAVVMIAVPLAAYIQDAIDSSIEQEIEYRRKVNELNKKCEMLSKKLDEIKNMSKGGEDNEH